MVMMKEIHPPRATVEVENQRVVRGLEQRIRYLKSIFPTTPRRRSCHQGRNTHRRSRDFN
ncbi:hypothetical protein SESBI_17896 [Sesbania bispinosa]|nr:hypothetical protein SESBI_17896 [Sesbania bispinosa]